MHQRRSTCPTQEFPLRHQPVCRTSSPRSIHASASTVWNVLFTSMAPHPPAAPEQKTVGRRSVLRSPGPPVPRSSGPPVPRSSGPPVLRALSSPTGTRLFQHYLRQVGHRRWTKRLCLLLPAVLPGHRVTFRSGGFLLVAELFYDHDERQTVFPEGFHGFRGVQTSGATLSFYLLPVPPPACRALQSSAPPPRSAGPPARARERPLALMTGGSPRRRRAATTQEPGTSKTLRWLHSIAA